MSELNNTGSKDMVVLSICTRNRLYQARSMMESVAAVMPDARRELLLVDGHAGVDVPVNLPFALTLGVDLMIPRFKVLAFANNPTGLCCLLKPAFSLYLLNKYPTATEFVYCDADTYWFAKPIDLLEQLASSEIVFTPHRLTPCSRSSVCSELVFSEVGFINAGLFGFRATEAARRFLQWWFESMETLGALDARHAYDQVWLSLGGPYFPEIALCRSRSVNVAYWNLDEREISRSDDGTFRVGTLPLSIFHFSYFDAERPNVLAIIHSREIAPPNAAVTSLLLDYAEILRTHGMAADRAIHYGFSRFLDGKVIKDIHRQYFRQRFLASASPEANPFDPLYARTVRGGLLSLYHADHVIKYIHRRLRSLI